MSAIEIVLGRASKTYVFEVDGLDNFVRVENLGPGPMWFGIQGNLGLGLRARRHDGLRRLGQRTRRALRQDARVYVDALGA